MDQDFEVKRTELANEFATAGAALLSHMNCAAAVAAIPGGAEEYAIAGTIRSIIALANTVDSPDLATQAQEAAPATDEHAMFEKWAGRYYRHATEYTALDHDMGWAAWQARASIAHPASAVEPLTDEAIDEVFGAMPGGVEGWLKQFGYRQFARSIARHTLVRVAASMAGTIRPTDDELWEQTIGERDCYHEWADKLAYAIAKHFNAEIGEHSNMNCPWAEALEVIEGAAQVEPVAIPAGYVLMPKQLTAENGAKSAFMGEFKEQTTVECPECEGTGEMFGGFECSECKGEGHVQQDVGVEWNTIKRIYARAVELLAAAPSPAAEGGATSEQQTQDQRDSALRAEPVGQRDADERAFFEHWDKASEDYGYGETHIVAYKAAQAAWKAATRCRAEGGDTKDNASSAGAAPSEQLAAPEQAPSTVTAYQVICASGDAILAGMKPGEVSYDFALVRNLGIRIEGEPDLAAPAGKALAEPIDRNKVRDAVAQALNGIYYCGRVWEAWRVNTMREDDFTPAAEVDEVLDEITEAAINAFATPTEPQGAARDAVLEEAAKAAEETDVATFTHAQVLHDDGSKTRSDIAAAIRALKANDKGADQAEKGGA